MITLGDIGIEGGNVERTEGEYFGKVNRRTNLKEFIEPLPFTAQKPKEDLITS